MASASAHFRAVEKNSSNAQNAAYSGCCAESIWNLEKREAETPHIEFEGGVASRGDRVQRR
jgi:hypothetical protein